jgi:hypothetical protein
MTTPYTQVQCPRCHAAAWALPNQAVPCQACGSPVPPTQPVAAPMPFGTPPPAAAAPGAPNAWGQAPMAAPMNNAGGPANLQPQQGGFKIPGLPGAFGKIGSNVGGNIKFKIIGGVVLAVALGVVGMVVKSKLKGSTAKGAISLSSIGVNAEHADPDAMIAGLAGPAKSWKKDAVWWSINVLGLRADGTIDLTSGGVAQVSYASPSAAGSHLKKERDDSVKEYAVNSTGASSNQLIGFTEVIENFEGPALPGCSIKQVAKILATKGLTGTKTAHVNFDRQFSSMVGVDAWHVLGDDPQLNLWINLADCSIVKS